MKFDEIKAHYEWFRTEANSWTDIGEKCRGLTAELECLNIQNQNPVFDEVYRAYSNLRASFITSTDGDTGNGYGVGAQLCDRVHDRMLDIAAAYARAEAETEADLAKVEKMIKG